jgi:hypothetical protein
MIGSGFGGGDRSRAIESDPVMKEMEEPIKEWEREDRKKERKKDKNKNKERKKEGKGS